MNSENATSSTSAPSQNLNLLSQDADLSPKTNGMSGSPSDLPLVEEEDFLTDPLVGLSPKGKLIRDMTEEELRQQVMLNNQLRQSFQTFKAEVEKAEEVNVKDKKQRAAAKPATATELDDLLS